MQKSDLNIVELSKIEHDKKRGMTPGALEPNLTRSSVFTVSNQIVGFYLRELPADISAVLDFANKELLSDRVPKSAMNRKQCKGKDDATGRYLYDTVTQHSCILGASPAKAHMRKHFPSISLVHKCPSAKKFVSAMIYLATKGGEIIRELAPEIYKNQKDIVEKFVKPKYRLTELYSSSISNFNIAAPYHQDMGNLPSLAKDAQSTLFCYEN